MPIDAALDDRIDGEERVASLLALGIDCPLKVDLLALLRQSGEPLSLDALAAACGGSAREIGATLDALVDAGLVARHRFYNLAEYTLADERVLDLLGETPADSRRLRLALLRRRT